MRQIRSSKKGEREACGEGRVERGTGYVESSTGWLCDRFRCHSGAHSAIDWVMFAICTYSAHTHKHRYSTHTCTAHSHTHTDSSNNTCINPKTLIGLKWTFSISLHCVTFDLHCEKRAQTNSRKTREREGEGKKEKKWKITTVTIVTIIQKENKEWKKKWSQMNWRLNCVHLMWIHIVHYNIYTINSTGCPTLLKNCSDCCPFAFVR